MQADGSRALNTRQVYVQREGRGRCGPSTAGLPPAPEGAASEEQPLPGALIFPLPLNMSTPAVPRRPSKRDPSTTGLTEPRVPAPGFGLGVERRATRSRQAEAFPAPGTFPKPRDLQPCWLSKRGSVCLQGQARAPARLGWTHVRSGRG